MKLLIDENLSPRLAAWLREQGMEAAHVRELALQHTPDPRIREVAARAGWTIVTQDDDFRRMQRPTDEPLLYLTCGNLRRAELIRRFAASWPDLRARLERGERVVETELPVA